MMRSQRGPLASTPFVSFPSDRISRFDPAPFRALLSVRSCRCGRHSTLLATTVQHAQQQGCWGAKVGRWSQQQQESAMKVELECVRTSSCAIWTCCSIMSWTAGVWRSWQTGYLSTGEPSWPWTRHWYHPNTGMAERYEVQPKRTVKLWRTHADERSAHTPNWLAKAAGLGLSFWQLKLGVGGPRRQRSSCQHCATFPKNSNKKVGERGSDAGKGCWVAQPRRLLPCHFWGWSLVVLMGQSLQCTRSFVSKACLSEWPVGCSQALRRMFFIPLPEKKTASRQPSVHRHCLVILRRRPDLSFSRRCPFLSSPSMVQHVCFARAQLCCFSPFSAGQCSLLPVGFCCLLCTVLMLMFCCMF